MDDTSGEQGRGFAVVAEEVRKLAEQSQEATKHIVELILVVQTETVNAVTGYAKRRVRSRKFCVNWYEQSSLIGFPIPRSNRHVFGCSWNSSVKPLEIIKSQTLCNCVRSRTQRYDPSGLKEIVKNPSFLTIFRP